jgi:16S rRNA (uracil1498-N3)-methyltransferase
MQLFYIPDVQGEFAFLKDEEAHHCVQVLRHKIGDTLHFTDGIGTMYEGVLVEATKKNGMLRIEKRVEQAPKLYHLHIAIAPTKQIERLEWFVEKATEIGIHEITPIYCHHSERKQLRIDRLEKVALSAVKQSLQAYLPKINPDIAFSDFLKSTKTNTAKKMMGYCADGVPRIHLKNNYMAGENALILIGPEGDFSEKEVQNALLHGFSAITLGENRLRTETAGVVACGVIGLMNE